VTTPQNVGSTVDISGPEAEKSYAKKIFQAKRVQMTLPLGALCLWDGINSP